MVDQKNNRGSVPNAQNQDIDTASPSKLETESENSGNKKPIDAENSVQAKDAEHVEHSEDVKDSGRPQTHVEKKRHIAHKPLSSIENNSRTLRRDMHEEAKKLKSRARTVESAIEHPIKFVEDERDRFTLAVKEDVDGVQDAAEGVRDFFVENAEAPINKQKLPIGMKILGVLTIVVGAGATPFIVFLFISAIRLVQHGALDQGGEITAIIAFIQIILLIISAVTFIVFGVTLLANKRRFSAYVVGFQAWLVVGGAICSLMVRGITWHIIIYLIALGLLVALNSYLDPSLSEERRLQRKLRDMDMEDEAEAGTLGYDVKGKGYITLNFYNMFWIFVVSSILGLIIETVWHYITVGGYQDRAGMLFGPFSPIYGFGALLMTIALNRFHDKPIIVIFLISAVIGGTFEYLTSWFLQLAYGVQAWNYDGMWLNIGGRTCGIMMIAWGALGVLWIKVLLPILMKIVNLIPWKARYITTSICFVLILIDGVMTFESVTCWSEREAGDPIRTSIQKFYAEYFPNEFMENRFQTMTLEPEKSIHQSDS